MLYFSAKYRIINIQITLIFFDLVTNPMINSKEKGRILGMNSINL